LARYTRDKKGNIVMDGFSITKEKEREYILNVKRSNSKRQYLLDKYYNQAKDTPNMVGVSKDSYAMLLEEKGFIPEKLSTTLQGLSTKEEFRQELKDLKTINKKGYNEKKVKTLRNKMLERLNENLGSAGVDVRRTIRNMSDSELMNMYIHSPKDVIAEIFGSGDDGEDEQEERAEKTRSTIDIVTHNITSKEKRDIRKEQLSQSVKRHKIIRGKKPKKTKK
jgi:hypothetical protein